MRADASSGRGPAPAIIAAPIEPIYRAVVARRNASFDRGRRVTRLPVPVVSVGNISVGGTGKTPMVMWCVRALRAAGRRPAIGMRGYGARVSKGVASPSDEQAEYLESLPGAPIAAAPDRASALRRLLREDKSVDGVVLDDGFQHRFVAGDVDIVLIDVTRDPFADRCLPAGWLREPVESLARAGVVALTHAERVSREAVETIRARVERVAPRARVFVSRHEWDGLEVGDESWPTSRLKGMRVLALCAVGNPGAFLAQARAAGAEVARESVRRDHAPYDGEAAARIVEQAAMLGCDGILTTSKDWVKLRPALEEIGAAGRSVPFVRPRLALAFDDEAGLRALLLASCGGAALLR
ncbi:MAG: tetraacyldisaccharide 4'-kinase [Phycisphaerales bacterium]|nr:tetraacyldisaccharide 4'-kinase [Phycisphaerales bacterium]